MNIGKWALVLAATVITLQDDTTGVIKFKNTWREEAPPSCEFSVTREEIKYLCIGDPIAAHERRTPPPGHSTLKLYSPCGADDCGKLPSEGR